MLAGTAVLTVLAAPVASDQLTGWDLGTGLSGIGLDSAGPGAEPAPPAGVDAADHPLGRPPTVAGDGGFAFLHVTGRGTPATPDPCRPVRVVVSGQAPPGADGVVEDAVDLLSAATGLRMLVEGPTDEVPTERRASYQPDRYGERWAPVLLAWTDPQVDPALAGDVAGMGGPAVHTARTGQPVVVTGQATLDTSQLARMGARPDGRAAVRAVVAHELAHVLGLGHVDDPTSLMNPRGAAVEPNDGDRRGLAALGRGPCVPAL